MWVLHWNFSPIEACVRIRCTVLSEVGIYSIVSTKTEVKSADWKLWHNQITPWRRSVLGFTATTKALGTPQLRTTWINLRQRRKLIFLNLLEPQWLLYVRLGLRLKPSTLPSVHTLVLCVLYGAESKQQLGLFRSAFTARYGLNFKYNSG